MTIYVVTQDNMFMIPNPIFDIDVYKGETTNVSHWVDRGKDGVDSFYVTLGVYDGNKASQLVEHFASYVRKMANIGCPAVVYRMPQRNQI